jgi:hypothetical protein
MRQSNIIRLTRLVTLATALFCYSCHTQNKISISQLGRTAEFNRDANTVIVNFNSKLKQVKLEVDKNKTYGVLVLANTRDDFLVVEYSQTPIGRTVEGDIVRFDANGKLIDKIFDAKTGELTGDLCLSKNDSKLLFTLQIDNFNPSDPLSQLNRPVSILILDLQQRKIIKKLDSIGLSLNVWINTTVWLKDESQFIYDFRTDRNVQVANEPVFDTINDTPGIHLYNLTSDKDSLLIPGGLCGVVSPIEDKIAYLKDEKIFTHDMNANSDELLYTLAPDEKVATIDWTPNGQFIRFMSWRASANEILIRISDKRKITIKRD